MIQSIERDAMDNVTVWMVKDLGDEKQSSFAKAKSVAQAMAMGNRGYTDWRELKKDGWASNPEKVVMPRTAWLVLESLQEAVT